MAAFDSLNKFLTQFTTRYISTRVVFLLDIIMSFVASLTTLALMNVIVRPGFYNIETVCVWLASGLVFSYLFIWLFHTYRIIIRHTTIKELGLFALVAFCKALATGLLFGIVYTYSRVLDVMVIADFFLTFLLFFLLRVVMVLAYNVLRGRVDESRNKKMKVLVYGVDVMSVSLISRLQDSLQYDIVGFIQHGNSTVRHIISERNVYYVNSETEFKNVVYDHSIDALLFASDNDIRMEKDRVIRYAIDNGIKMLSAPPIDEMVDGNVVHSIRNIDIEDLLMRSEIKISMYEIMENLKGQTILVTGAAGSIGSELCRQLATVGIDKLIMFDNAETPIHNLRLEFEEKYPDLDFVAIVGDVRVPARLDYVFSKYRPQTVFHAAAYKHVPLMEENPCEAVLVNVVGTRYVADKCVEYDTDMMVMVSTDKAVNPTNVMGCTKRIAEVYVQSLGLAIEKGEIKGKTKFVTTRFGNVLGSSGSVIPRFREQIAKGGPVTVTHPEITRFFMTIPEACRLVLEAALMSTGNQIFVFDMGEPIKIDSLARRMIELAGYVPDKDIKIEYTGLRPGEKLYEEVLSNHENTIPTDHGSIRIAKAREYDYQCAHEAVNTLETLSRNVDIAAVVKTMKKMIPEYISSNSRFEEFDKDKDN